MDNLDPSELATKLPVIDKALQKAIQKSQMKVKEVPKPIMI